MASIKFDVLMRKDNDSETMKSNDSNCAKLDEDVEPDKDADNEVEAELIKADENTNKFHFPAIPEIGKDEHQLQYCYCLWFSRRNQGKTASIKKYEDSIRLIGAFSTVEQYWAYYSFMVRSGELTGHSDIHLFKHGMRPMWEDKANQNGGKWIVRLRKGLASRCWENLILAMLGEQFMVGPEVCGAVVSIRYQEDIISIWNRNASDQATTSRIRATLSRVLNLPQNTIMEYKAHRTSLNDHSSYRNTSVFVR